MTFELLVPLGLLGLIGIAILILIYVIRPNYQARHVTSTYIWKLSLNYKRKRPPVNKIRNIIIFLCQLLILASMAMIMAWPSLVERTLTDENDVVYILDSSASMYTETDGATRFDRALAEIRSRAENVFSTDGKVTLIVAEEKPRPVAERVDLTRRMSFLDALDKLGTEGASYGTSDVEAALAYAKETVLRGNPNAQLILFTDTTYSFVPPRVQVEREKICDPSEWNAAILNAEASLQDGYYTLTVQVACYGTISQDLEISVSVEGGNSIPASEIAGESITFAKHVRFSDSETKTVIFGYGIGSEDDEEANIYRYDLGLNQRFFSYESIRIGIEADDSYSIDNSFYLYGGQKERLKVEYFSSDPNPFIQTALAKAGSALSALNNFQLDVTEIKKGEEPILEGFDLYIFEHQMPERLPDTGAVILLDPDPRYGPVPSEAGFRAETLSDYTGDSFTLAEGPEFEGHPVSRFIDPSGIELSLYDVISDYDPSYDVLLEYDSKPLLMVQNNGATKIAVMAFSVHYSNLAKLPENFLLMYSIIDYFFPPIISGNAFEVGDEFTVNTWGDELTFNVEPVKVFQAEEMPTTLSIDKPGSYSFEQETFYGKDITVEVFIKPPAEESDICKVVDSISDPYEGTEPDTLIRDLLVIFAAVLVGLLFLEWFLQSRDNK